MTDSWADLVIKAREGLETRVAMLHNADQQLMSCYGSPERHAQLTAIWHKLRDRMIPEAETFLDHCLLQWAKEEWGPIERPTARLGERDE